MAGPEEMSILNGIVDGSYETVTPEENCTIAVAKQLQLLDNLQADGIKQFNSNDDDSSIYTLCTAKNDKEDVAVPLCGVEHGPGYVRIGSKCVYNECPAGFTDSGDACEKPSIPYQVSSTTKCDERWYDWFTIKNYHIGNGYTNNSDKCLSPCPDGYVPDSGSDSVDGALKSLYDTSDPTKCIPVAGYFWGKYSNTPPFCPLSIIQQYVVTADNSISQKEHVDAYNKYVTDQTKTNTDDETDANPFKANDKLNIQTVSATNASSIHELALAAQNDSKALLTKPLNGAMTNACNNLYNDNPERLKLPYSHCQRLLNNATSYQAATGLALTPDQLNNFKMACNMTFCDDNTINHLKSIATDEDNILDDAGDVKKICFPNLQWGKKNTPVVEGSIQKLIKWLKNPNNGQTTLWLSFKAIGLLIICPVLFLLAYFFIKHVIWERIILKIIELIKNILWGYTSRGHEIENSAILAAKQSADLLQKHK